MQSMARRSRSWTLVLTLCVLAACAAPGQSGRPASGAGSRPTSSRPPVTASANGEASQPADDSPIPGETETEAEPINLGDVAGIRFGEPAPTEIGGVSVIERVGSIQVSDGGGEVIVSISGSSEAAVAAFADEAKFRFELGEPVKVDGESATDPNETLSQGRTLGEPDSESVAVTFQLSESTARERPVGSLIATIDPTVRYLMYHNFSAKDPSTDYASITLEVSTGKVVAALFRKCAYIGSATDSAITSWATRISGRGLGSFDAAVRGLNTGYNTYRILGTWNYDYGAYLANAYNPSITCP
jgi:hypothetical protein